MTKNNRSEYLAEARLTRGNDHTTITIKSTDDNQIKDYVRELFPDVTFQVEANDVVHCYSKSYYDGKQAFAWIAAISLPTGMSLRDLANQAGTQTHQLPQQRVA